MAISPAQGAYPNAREIQQPRFGNAVPFIVLGLAAAAAKKAQQEGGSYPSSGGGGGPSIVADWIDGIREYFSEDAKTSRQVGRRQGREAGQCKGYLKSLQRALDAGKIKPDGKATVETNRHETITHIPFQFGSEAYELQIFESIGGYTSWAFQSKKRVPDFTDTDHSHPAKGLSYEQSSNKPQVWQLDFEGAHTQARGESASYVYPTSDKNVAENAKAFMNQLLKLADRPAIGEPAKSRVA